MAGPLPEELGMLANLEILDLSNNQFSGVIPTSAGQPKNLNYLRLNNNNLSGPFPASLANISGLSTLDLSYNNLSGSVPRTHAKTFECLNFNSIRGNPLPGNLCRGEVQNCSGESRPPMTFSVNSAEGDVAI